MNLCKKVIFYFLHFFIFISIISFCIFSTLNDYQRAFIALRIKNFIIVPILYAPSDIYALPDNWLKQIQSAYTPERPKYPRQKNPMETDVDPNAIYRGELMKSGLSASARDDFEKSLAESNAVRECLSSPRQCVGFLPARQSAFTKRADGAILDRNGIVIPMVVLPGRSDRVLIALHGKGGSPEGIVCQRKDYANCFGAYWNSKGYTVYAPAVEGRQDWSVPRLNLDSTSSDLAKIEDLILYIKSNNGKNINNIYVAGISYGAFLAEYASFLFKDVSGVISIGGEGRYIFGESEFSLPSSNFTNTNRNFLRNAKIFYLIPDHKPILISIGINDSGQFNDDGYGKFRIFTKLNSKKNIKFHFFNGGHESDPVREFQIFTTMIDKNVSGI
jgi:hypothetical protein